MQFWYCLFLEVKEMGSQWKEGKLIQLFLRFSWLVVIDMIFLVGCNWYAPAAKRAVRSVFLPTVYFCTEGDWTELVFAERILLSWAMAAENCLSTILITTARGVRYGMNSSVKKQKS